MLLKNNNKNILNLIKLKIHPETKNIYKYFLEKKWNDIDLIQKHNSQYYNDSAVFYIVLLFKEWSSLNNDNCFYFSYFLD
jgi:hypothetical protein